MKQRIESFGQRGPSVNYKGTLISYLLRSMDGEKPQTLITPVPTCRGHSKYKGLGVGTKFFTQASVAEAL
jgi:hypothetical protein